MSKMIGFVSLLFMLITQVVSAQEEDLDAILESYMTADAPGVVVLVDTPDDTYSAVQGLADLEQGTPVQLSDRFRIASMSKPFVAVATLQLVDEGVVGLDDLISDYLPSEVIENIPYANEVTVRQLLNMTSGIFNYTESDAFYEDVTVDPSHDWSAAETVTYAYGQEAYFAPGEGYYYSNTNYTLLEMIIEAVTGESLGENLRTGIFEPLGMNSSFVEDGAQLGQNLVQGYSDFDGNGTLDNVTLVNDGIGLGDGGVVSTAEDLVLFLRGLFEGELVSEELLAEMMDLVEDGEGGYYGLGLSYYDMEFGEGYGHAGLSSGFESDMTYYPDEDIVVIVLSNTTDSGAVESIAYDAAELFLEE